MRKFKCLMATAAAVLPSLIPALWAAPVHAQSIDYGSMESLFGEPVTTSATGSPQRSTEVPADMTIISADDIRRSGAHDLPTLLGRVPGIDVLNWSTDSSDVGVRGYDQPMSPRLLVLVNGRQVYLDHYGYTAWSTLPVQLSEIRQIEVVKGPNAALFGFNAVSGVVNIITYNPKYDNVSGGSVSVGSRNDREASLVQTVHLTPKIAARLSVGAAKANEWDNTANIPSNELRSDPARATVNLDTVASLTDKTELRFESSLANTQVSDMVSNYSPVYSKYITGSVKLGITSDTPLGLVTGSAYRNTLRVTNDLGGIIEFHNTITAYNAQDLFKLGKHTFRVGVEYRDNQMPTGPLTGGEVRYRVTAPSAMWSWAIADNFSTSVALRSDNLSLKRTGGFPAGFPLADNALWNRKISALSYNAGAVWRVDDKDTLKLMTAKGIQAPTLIELGGIQLAVPLPVGALAVMGNPFIQPAVVKNTELSYDHSFKAVKIGVRLFSQTTKNVVGQSDATDFFQAPTLTTYPAISWNNAANSKMTGVELSASGKYASGVRWSGDYTSTEVKDTAINHSNLVARLADFAQSTPKSRANASLGWAGGKWSVDGFVHYTSAFDSYALNTGVLTPIKAYTTLAANVAYAITPKMSVALSGQNLGNSHQVQTTGLRVPQTVFLTLNSNW